VQAQLGVDEPDFGMLFADMCFCDGEEVPIERVLQPRVEAEIALVLATDLPGPDLTVLDLLAATAFALPALELVGSRVAKWDITIVDTVADNASSGLFVLGTRPVAVDAFDPRLCGMILEVDGVEAALGAGAACMGNPFNAALWLARRMAAVGRPLLAGDVVLTGALGPMVPVLPGQTVEARIEDVGVVRAELAEVAS
jgi:2-keto-4-pentenoate hydratase